MIIEPKRLKQKLQSETLCLLDARSHEDYLDSHIPGATHFDTQQTNASKDPVKGLLPDVQTFVSYLNSKGIAETNPVIVYDQHGGPSSGRVAWTLLTFGHPNVSILNGGFGAWLSEGHHSDNIEPSVDASQFTAKLVDDYIADQTLILSKLKDKNTVFLDVRSPDEYRGIDLRSARGGHIPGAINMDWTQSKDTDNNQRFKNKSVLKKHIEQLGISQENEIIVYCQSHQRSALIWVLLKSLGYSKVRGYPGSWSDWGNTNDTQIEK